MRLSTRGEYGVRTMVELASAYGTGPVSLGRIADSENLSLAYLEQLIAVLRREGLVESVRGAHGGYQLAMAPEKISVGDIVRALEGPIAPVDCVAEGKEGRCGRETVCATRSVWVSVRDRIAETLDSVTLADLKQQSCS